MATTGLAQTDPDETAILSWLRTKPLPAQKLVWRNTLAMSNILGVVVRTKLE